MPFPPHQPPSVGSTSVRPTTAPVPKSRPRSRRPAIEVGTRIGKYVIAGVFGEGVFGVVLRAVHPTLRLPVALKLLDTARVEGQPALRERFLNEARLLARINHPRVVRLLDCEDDPAGPYLVLEHVEGLNLAELIQHRGQLPAAHAVRLIAQAAEGLAAAHACGVLHRDIKPANILISRGGEVKVADFGQAISLDELSPASGEPGGTPGYLAPEQFLEPHNADQRADIYALGATFYHAVTGRMPFIGPSARAVIFKHATEPVTPANKLNPNVPEAVSAVITRMLAKSPADRYAGYPELLQALSELPSAPAEATGPGSLLPRDWSAKDRAGTIPLAGTPLPKRLAGARNGDAALAERLLRQAAEDLPEKDEWLWLAELTDSPAEVVASLQQALRLHPTNEQALARIQTARLAAARAALRAGNRVAARHYLLSITAQDPNHEQAWLWLARVAPTPAEARRCLRTVQRLNPENAHARAALGECPEGSVVKWLGGWVVREAPALKSPPPDASRPER